MGLLENIKRRRDLRYLEKNLYEETVFRFGGLISALDPYKINKVDDLSSLKKGKKYIRIFEEHEDDKEFYKKLPKKTLHFAYKFASDRIKNDAEITEKAVEASYFNFEYASFELRSDKQFATKLLGINGSIIEFCPNELLADKKFVKAYMKSNNSVYYDRILDRLPESIKNDKKIMKEFFEIEAKKGHTFNDSLNEIFTSCNSLKNDKEFVLNYIEFIKYDNLPKKLQNDVDIGKAYVANRGWNLNTLNEKLKDNPEVVKVALKHDSRNIEYASKRLRSDENFVLENIKLNDVYLGCLPELKDNFEFVKKVVKEWPAQILHASPRLANNIELLNYALKNDDYRGYLAEWLIKEKNENGSEYIVSRQVLKQLVEENPHNVKLNDAYNKYLHPQKVIYSNEKSTEELEKEAIIKGQ